MSSTNFLNAKRRRIFQSGSGAFYSQGDDGKKVYGMKARYRKVGGGAIRLIASQNTVPNKIRSSKFKLTSSKAPRFTPASAVSPMMIMRKVRKNKGVARKVMMSPVYNLNHPVFRARKVRKNKGVARGPRSRGVKFMGVHTRFE